MQEPIAFSRGGSKPDDAPLIMKDCKTVSELRKRPIFQETGVLAATSTPVVWEPATALLVTCNATVVAGIGKARK